MHTSQQCPMGSSSCSTNLTQTLMDQLSSMGFKVSMATYNVLVSYPNMTQPSTLKTMDSQGNVIHSLELYGGKESRQGSHRKVSWGSAYVLDGINEETVLLTGEGSQSMPIYIPYTPSSTVQVMIPHPQPCLFDHGLI